MTAPGVTDETRIRATRARPASLGRVGRRVAPARPMATARLAPPTDRAVSSDATMARRPICGPVGLALLALVARTVRVSLARVRVAPVVRAASIPVALAGRAAPVVRASLAHGPAAQVVPVASGRAVLAGSGRVAPVGRVRLGRARAGRVLVASAPAARAATMATVRARPTSGR